MANSGGFLTTHVLDTARGVPASGINIELFEVNDGQHTKIGSATTNNDGRTDTPILEQEHFGVGQYELVFHVGDYLRGSTPHLEAPLFLDLIPIRFGINDATSHYHVPLLLSPFGYSTYRGS